MGSRARWYLKVRCHWRRTSMKLNNSTVDPDLHVDNCVGSFHVQLVMTNLRKYHNTVKAIAKMRHGYLSLLWPIFILDLRENMPDLHSNCMLRQRRSRNVLQEARLAKHLTMPVLKRCVVSVCWE